MIPVDRVYGMVGASQFPITFYIYPHTQLFMGFHNRISAGGLFQLFSVQSLEFDISSNWTELRFEEILSESKVLNLCFMVKIEKLRLLISDQVKEVPIT